MGFAFFVSAVVDLAIDAAINYVVSSVISSIVVSAFSNNVPDQQQAPTQQQNTASLVADAAGRQQVIRSSGANRVVIYGQAKVSGPLVYAFVYGAMNEYVWIVVALADHEVTAIDDVYLNDDIITNDMLLGDTVAGGKYNNYVAIEKHLGGPGQSVDTSLNFIDPNWTAAHVGVGVAYIAVRLRWSQTIFPSGIPNISCIVRGKKVYDPRDTVTKYSFNPALIRRDYLTDSTYGLSCDTATEIDDTTFIAAANVCEERVLMPTTISNALASVCTMDGAVTNYVFTDLAELIQTGDGVRFTSTGALPSGIEAGTTYYWFRIQSGEGMLASTYANALLGSPHLLGTGQTGVLTITYYDQARYECQGVLNTGDAPMKILKDLVTSDAGTMVFQQGTWRCYSGAYNAAESRPLTADDLRGPLSIQTNVERKQLFNGVRGTYIDPNNEYQATDFPIVKSAAYALEDGEEILRDMTLPYTGNSFRAQRIAQIYRNKSRQGIAVAIPCKFTAFRYCIWNNVALTFTAPGWTLKEFTVQNWTLNPAGGVDLQLQEEAASAYTWTPDTDAVVKDTAPDTNLPDPFNVAAITGTTLTSGTAALFLAGDGTVHSRIRVVWATVMDIFVADGGHIEIQYALSAGSPQSWQDMPKVDGTATEAFISPVEDGVLYDVRIRAMNPIGTVSTYAYVRGHMVIGKTELPSDVTGFSALQQGATVVFGCDTVTDGDLDSVEIRIGPNNGTGFDDATPITNILRGQTATSAAVPPGTWMTHAKSKDTSGNYSSNAATCLITVTADGYTTIVDTMFETAWVGTLTNMVKHWTGVLTPMSQDLASALGWEVFDEYVHNPYADCYFTTGITDKNVDASARIYGLITSVLGPGELTGVAAPTMQVDARLSTEVFDGYVDWTIGNVSFRYLVARVHVDTSIGIPVVTNFNLRVDAGSRQESGVLTVGGSGNGTVTFTNQFHNAPVLQLTPSGAGNVSASYASLANTGFTGYYKTAGVASAGDIAWLASGV